MPAVTSGVPRTSQSVIDLIGNTPLIRLSSFERAFETSSYGPKLSGGTPAAR